MKRSVVLQVGSNPKQRLRRILLYTDTLATNRTCLISWNQILDFSDNLVAQPAEGQQYVGLA